MTQVNPQSDDGNVIATFALMLVDRMYEATTEVMGQGHMTGAALIQIGEFPGQSIDALRYRLGLSHSAVVRLTDQLVDNGYINKERTIKSDARVAVLTLTPLGRKQRTAVLAARKKLLEKILKPLAAKDVKAVAGSLGKVLTSALTSSEEAEHACRFCDIAAVRFKD